MDDIIIDNKQPVEVVVDGKTISLRAKSFGAYVLDMFLKAMLMFLLLSISFGLFVQAGNYPAFVASGEMAPEIIRILSGFFIVALVVMILLSFSSWAQNLMLALVAGIFVLMMLGLFATFDRYTFLSDTLRIYVNERLAEFVYGISDVTLAFLVAVLVLVYMSYALRSNIAYLLGALILICGYIWWAAYFNRYDTNHFDRDVDTIPQTGQNAAVAQGKKFVYIMLPNAASYNYLMAMDEATVKDSKVANLKHIMLGFYARNGFKLFPNAYNKYTEIVKNQVNAMNPLSSDTEENMFNQVISDRSWQFNRLNDKTAELKNNQLSLAFKKAGYAVSAYQSRGLDMCRSGLVANVDRCINKINVPVNTKLQNMSITEKEYLLLAQWLERSGMLENPSFLYKTLDMVVDAQKIPVIGTSYASLYVINAPETLEIALKDIVADKGNGAYYIYVDLPADMFVYNEFCMLKPQNEWLPMHLPAWANKDAKDNLSQRRKAYAEQYICLFGKLQNMLDKMAEAKILDNSVVVIQGISAPQDKSYGAENPVAQFGADWQTNVAIRDARLGGFEASGKVCLAPDIVKSYLFKAGNCQEQNYTTLSQAAFDVVKAKLGSLIPEPKEVKEAQKYFEMWYKYWAKANGIDTKNMSSMAKEESKTEVVLPEINDNKNISKNIEIKEEVKLEDEVKTESLKQAMEKTALQSNDANGVNNQPQEGEQQSE